MTKQSDIFSDAKNTISAIGKRFGFSAQDIENFLIPNRIVEVKLQIGKKNKKNFVGIRSQHNNLLGPYKGGIRFHKNVTRSEVMALSLWMTIKCSVANLPYGGSKGGIIVDPKKLSPTELEELSRSYAKALYEVIGANKDIPAPDVNTNPVIIEWMSDEYDKISTKENPNLSDEMRNASFTGKPLLRNGLEGRVEATGYGGVVVLSELVKQLGKSPKNTTIAIQGFGNVGYHFALFAQQKGFRIVSVSDSKGAIIMDKKGRMEDIDIPLVLKCKKEKGYLAGCYCVGGVCDIKSGRTISNKDLLSLPVDILVPSALEEAINENNMKKVKAKIIIEMANGPVTQKAYDYLSKKGVIIVPDVLANAGGVVGSYGEWKQNLENAKYTKKQTFSLISKHLTRAFRSIWKIHDEKKSTLKEAAYIFALTKLVK